MFFLAISSDKELYRIIRDSAIIKIMREILNEAPRIHRKNFPTDEKKQKTVLYKN